MDQAWVIGISLRRGGGTVMVDGSVLTVGGGGRYVALLVVMTTSSRECLRNGLTISIYTSNHELQGYYLTFSIKSTLFLHSVVEGVPHKMAPRKSHFLGHFCS